MEEEDDPVVQEIPVYLSQALAKNLYIYQYPVKPANREWSDMTIVNASVKPRNQLVRLEVGLDTYSDKYCVSKGEQIALNTDGNQESSRYIKDKEKEKSPYFRNGIMDKIVYESSHPCHGSERYSVAILQDKELHVTPVQGIVQLRPSYSYFDKQEKRKKDSVKDDNSEEEEDEPEAQQVTVKFARQETDVAKKMREKSFEFLSKQSSEEPWYQALWKHSSTDHADLERLKLFTANTTDDVSLRLPSAQYVRALVPPSDDSECVAELTDSLSEQIKRLLISAKLVSLSDISTTVKADIPTVLSALSSCVCVRGVWAARSADVFGDNRPHHTHLAAARDHVLYLFTQHSYVDRRKVAAAVRLPPEEVLEIIRSIAKYNQNTGWELLIPPDVAFETKYPDIVQRHKMYLEGRQRLFNETMLGENVSKRQRKKSQRDSVSSDTMMSPKPRCNSVSEDDSDSRKRSKNKSATGSGKRTRHVSSSSAHET